MILALNDGKEPIIAAEAEVGPFVAGAADLLDLEAEHLEELADEFLERLGGERGELGQLQIGAAGLVALPFQPFATVANRLRASLRTSSSWRAASAASCAAQVAIDLEQRVVDRVVEPRPLGAGQLVVVAPEDGVLQVLDRAGELGERCDRRRVFLVGSRGPEQSLRGAAPAADDRRRGEAAAWALSHSSTIAAHCGPRHSVMVDLRASLRDR